ncbi:inorganic phosphate transporter [Chlorogloea sp. CCALA 695]|uniref:inorganic phosphate transporter n=1 Tax=Chlorogloea sp. CCALA 695 TaxID=2107693 RepID=UPI000D04C122|nr:inorganic phosphate transporter [Chlorogloea sp. CCALA 695]PSB31135.1 phosphate permease [Chlorogloea sp. CCALA 695]
MIFIVAFLAFYVAWNLGANDVANSMGTSVGSKAVTLRQALVIAGVLEFTGAVLFGQEVSQTLATEIVNPALFTDAPQVLLLGMTSVLIACGAWLQIATSRGLPVASSHAVVGAIAGFSVCSVGINAIAWSSIGLITLGWIITPILSAVIAALLYKTIKYWILDRTNKITQLEEWIPWLSVALVGVFGVIVFPTITNTPLIANLPIPRQDVALAIGGFAAIGITFNAWRQLAADNTPNDAMVVERQLAFFQLLSACFVAFAHGSNDVGNAIAPLAVIIYIINTGSVPQGFLTIPLWILVLGGAGIVAGLAVWGEKVIATIGSSIISLQPSGGFCAELATATTILLASRLGLPVSTSHALVGGLVGIGLVQNYKSIQFSTLKNIAKAWIVTIPISAALSAGLFSLAKWLFL